MLVGRDRELAEIVAALDAAAAGRGRLVLVLGPPGIGKSALVAAALERAPDRGFSVARGYAVDDPGAPPLWPWSRVTRGWTELAGQPVADVEEGDAAARFARFVTMADALAERSARQPLLVVLEDLHWADPQSLQLLRHICGGLAALPLCLLVTARDASAPAALGELAGRDGATTLELVGLSAADLAQWLPDLDEAGAEQLRERTGGNPLLVRLLGGEHAVDVEAPASGVLRRIAAARLGSLDERARAVVEAAAVVAERIDPGILGVVVGHPVDTELAAAVALGVLRLGADGVSFAHALVRDAVYAQIAVRALGELHRRVAVALAGVPGVPPGPVAVHWQRAAGSDARHECVQWAERADGAARSALAYDDALRYAELAADLVDRPDAEFAPDDCARVLVRLAEAQFLAGRLEACLATCRRAADVASAAGRADLVARAGLAIVGVGNPEVNTAVASICERALRELPADARAVRARLLAQIAVGAAEGEGGARPAELAVQALEAADASGDPQALVEAIAARHLAISVPQTVTERLELGRRVIEVGATLGRTMPALWGHLWRADASLQLGNLAEFDHELGEIDRVARTRRSVLARWHHHRFTASRAVLLGNYASARAADGAAFELACQVGDFSLLGMSYAFRGLLAGVRGDPADLAPHWYETLAAAPPMPLIKVAIPTALALLGRIDEARAAFEPFRALPATFPAGVRWAATLGQVGKTAVLLEDGKVAGAAHDALAGTAAYYSGDGSGGIFSFGANAGMLGDFALAAGRLDAALEHYRTAIGLNRRIGARPYVALAQLGEAVVLRRTGAEPDVAAAALAEAGAEFVRLDLPGPLAQAVALGYRRARDATPPSPLTTRESEIATLVADALSNREIAVRLVLSERTVEAHVRSILAKLGFTTRTEIATWQVRLGR